MSDVEFVPAQILEKRSDDILAVTEVGSNGKLGLTKTFNFLSDKVTKDGVTQDFRTLNALEAAEAELFRVKFKEMGGKPRLAPGQGTWH